MTIRAFPIRVAGNSGPLTNEIAWETINKNTGYKDVIKEYSSVTKKLRRVAEFDHAIVCKAIEINNPTQIILNHLDYVCAPELHETINGFVSYIEKSICHQVKWLGFGPDSLVERG